MMTGCAKDSICIVFMVLICGGVWRFGHIGRGSMRCRSAEEVYAGYSVHMEGEGARLFIDFMMTSSEMENIAMVVKMW